MVTPPATIRSLLGAVLCLGGLLPTSVRAQEATGTLDPGFHTGSGFAGYLPYVGADFLALQPDGKILAAGLFKSYDGVNRPGLARLNADGTLDTGFDPTAAVDAAVPVDARGQGVDSFALQPDGKVLVTVLSVRANDDDPSLLSVWTLVRLNPDGSPDTGFVFHKKSYGRPRLAVQPDGRIVVSRGKIRYVEGYYDVVSQKFIDDGKMHATDGPADQLLRLDADGSRDGSFAAGPLVRGEAYALAVQPDGKILLGGTFKKVEGGHGRHFARLNADGSVDTRFGPNAANTGALPYVIPKFLVVQPDGKILTGGQFTSVENVPLAGLARLDADGGVDSSFDPEPGLLGQPGANTDGAVGAAVQTDAKVIVVGSFETADGVARNGVARLNADGSLDTRASTRAEGRISVPTACWCSRTARSSSAASSRSTTARRSGASPASNKRWRGMTG